MPLLILIFRLLSVIPASFFFSSIFTSLCFFVTSVLLLTLDECGMDEYKTLFSLFIHTPHTYKGTRRGGKPFNRANSVLIVACDKIYYSKHSLGTIIHTKSDVERRVFFPLRYSYAKNENYSSES